MRLIDADALKQMIPAPIEDEYKRVHQIIDNAPTVAISCKDCDGYEAGYSAGLNDADRPQGMNDILRSLIKWTEENEVIPEIYFTTISGGIYLNLVLRYHGKGIKHEFYVPGGVLCLNNWDMFPMGEEVNLFIKEAKAALLEKGDAE